jgi:hypothetical protein
MRKLPKSRLRQLIDRPNLVPTGTRRCIDKDTGRKRIYAHDVWRRDPTTPARFVPIEDAVEVEYDDSTFAYTVLFDDQHVTLRPNAASRAAIADSIIRAEGDRLHFGPVLDGKKIPMALDFQLVDLSENATMREDGVLLGHIGDNEVGLFWTDWLRRFPGKVMTHLVDKKAHLSLHGVAQKEVNLDPTTINFGSSAEHDSADRAAASSDTATATDTPKALFIDGTGNNFYYRAVQLFDTSGVPTVESVKYIFDAYNYENYETDEVAYGRVTWGTGFAAPATTASNYGNVLDLSATRVSAKLETEVDLTPDTFEIDITAGFESAADFGVGVLEENDYQDTDPNTYAEYHFQLLAGAYIEYTEAASPTRPAVEGIAGYAPVLGL